MKLELGKCYKDSRGDKVRIYALDADLEENIVHGAVFNGLGWFQSMWLSDGTPYGSTDYKSPIVSEWKSQVRVEGWINVYEYYTSSVYATEEAARADAAAGVIACVYVRGIEGDAIC